MSRKPDDPDTIEFSPFQAQTDPATDSESVEGEPADGSTDESIDDRDNDIDSEFAPQAKRRLGKGTALLAALVVAAAGFLIGIQVQKHQTSTSTTARGDRTAFAGRAGFGAGTGGLPSGTGFGGGTETGGTAGTGGSGTGAAAAPAVIGTIASVTGNTITVTNFGGKTITVTLSSTTAVTKQVASAALKKGDTVTVTGKAGTDGTVAATAVNAK